mmetsp:Transcript_5708/g.16754  ORF Transcript_5708/g.16754 Transcript_5708/m.16754 type:complete len:232 (-) Transcript_5708:975-1670(-)
MSVLKRAEIDSPVWMARMAPSRSFPTEITRIFLVTACTSARRGTVLATTTSSRAHDSMRVPAGPLKRPWVAKAKTRSAPKVLSSLAAVQRVPAVSIMSSTMMQSQPSTEPTRCMEPTTPARARCLMITARETFRSIDRSPSRNALARVTPPASGDTTTGFLRFFNLKYDRAMGPAKRLSTGVRGPKKPWICPQWRSTQHTRSTPMASIILATSAAEMGTRARSFRSCRAYP